MAELVSVLLVLGIPILLVVGIWLIVSYNRFQRDRVLVNDSWSGIDVELTRRHDLVPNLVRTVQAYDTHERELLEQVTRDREEAQAHRPDNPGDRERYEDRLGGSMARLIARAEAYPDLKASENFLQLQRELSMTENRIAAARRFYNGNVRRYNSRVRTFPSNVVASMFNFELRSFFELRHPSVADTPPAAF